MGMNTTGGVNGRGVSVPWIQVYKEHFGTNHTMAITIMGSPANHTMAITIWGALPNHTMAITIWGALPNLMKIKGVFKDKFSLY